jgi:hypothetical protein
MIDAGVVLVDRFALSHPRFLALLILSGLFHASGSAAQDWEPPPPMPDDFDWVQLNSGEWLKGEIRVMYEDVLEFDSEELDSLSLDLEDIKVIRSAQIISLRVSRPADEAESVRFGGQTAIGKLLLEDDVATVIGDYEVSFPRSTILSITAGVPRERNYWSGDIVVGGNFRTGNTEQTEANTRINFQRRTVVGRMVFDHMGNYSRTNSIETANNQRGSIRWDRFRTERLFVTPVFAEYFIDTFQNIALRYTLSPAVGYQIRDTSTMDWSVSIGPAYQQTRYDEVVEGENQNEGAWALSAGMVFEADLTRRLEFDYDYRFQLTSKDAGTYNHHMVGAFSFELTDSFDFDISVIWDRIRDPRRNADGSLPEQDDYRLSLGIAYEF